jgi:hypothetical protein
MYRVFWIGDAGCLLGISRPFEASDDTDAQKQAGIIAECDYVEVRQGSRLVASLNAKPADGAIH